MYGFEQYWFAPDIVPVLNTTVEEDEDTRVSALLGPDGNPLIIKRARNRIGFDLRPVQRKDTP